ncbi:hypothetical protein BVRB_1g003850 isoform A [Beta vulgaris subsp. vulgaris]|uniref:nuclear transcription factor Y subunit B-9 n=1 Tax=Beta vulgaris subsp. vulgaris TaxID=3555 RepID=UPI00053F4EEA|nr:nuclear transcription factor Y subunit B-9 [Beta vulgaris subsp. vulgaris]KMT20386.1 hypothetical protein BVRB_1g003850 isoform A [Beta vulgaris subsp. vulgaris]
MPLVGDANGLNRTTNNIQGSMPNPSQIQDNIGNKAPTLRTNHSTPILRSKSSLAPFREHELYMPIANVVRIMRRALPPHAKVADEAKEMLQECVSEFISFITSEANETCQLEHRKTITAEDLIGAMSRLGFDHYVQPLSIYLQKYRESEMLPLIPRRGVGNIGTEATLVTPTTNVLPPFAVVHPQFAMFSTSANNGGNYHDGSGTSSGPISMSHLYTATASEGSGPSLALGIGGDPSSSDSLGPSGSPQAGLDFYNPYGHYK